MLTEVGRRVGGGEGPDGGGDGAGGGEVRRAAAAACDGAAAASELSAVGTGCGLLAKQPVASASVARIQASPAPSASSAQATTTPHSSSIHSSCKLASQLFATAAGAAVPAPVSCPLDPASAASSSRHCLSPSPAPSPGIAVKKKRGLSTTPSPSPDPTFQYQRNPPRRHGRFCCICARGDDAAGGADGGVPRTRRRHAAVAGEDGHPGPGRGRGLFAGVCCLRRAQVRATVAQARARPWAVARQTSGQHVR